MNSRSGKVSPEILLFVIIVALIGFVGFSAYETNQKFEVMKGQIGDAKTEGKADVKELADQLGKRYLQLLKLAEDLAMQQGQLTTIQRSLTTEKDSMADLQSSLKSEVASLQKDRGEQSEAVAALQEKFKIEIETKEKTIARLQSEFDSLKTSMDDQSALLVMIREQAIVNSATAGAATNSGADAAAPGASAPAGSQGPQSFQAGAIVPINSTEASPLQPAAMPVTPQPTPVPVHDAETIPGKASAQP